MLVAPVRNSNYERDNLIVQILGAGPAGSTLAYILARRGDPVRIFDERWPRRKACGEGILPGGVRVLREIGLLDDLLAAGARPFRGILFHARGDDVWMPFGREFGIAVSRDLLDNFLLTKALAAGAVWGREDDTTRIVRATGRPVSSCRRVGFSTHIRDERPSEKVEVFIKGDYEIYTASVDGGKRVVSVLARNRGRKWEDFELPEWLRQPCEKVIGANVTPTRARGEDSVDAIGDAYRTTDPCAAQGIMCALLSAYRYAHGLRPNVRRAVLVSSTLPWLSRSPFLRLVARIAPWAAGAFDMSVRAEEKEVIDEIARSEIPQSMWRFLRFANWILVPSRRSARDKRPFLSRVAVDVGGGDGSLAKRRGAISFDLHPPPFKIPGVRYVVGDVRMLPFRSGSIGEITAVLTFHHLETREIARALAECQRVAARVVVVDLRRTFFSWLVVRFVTFLFGDRIVRRDGPLSVRRSFIEEEVRTWKPRRLRRRALIGFIAEW